APPTKLHPELERRIWKPGQSGNPTGKGSRFRECQSICREASPDAAQTLVVLMDDEDPKIRGWAADRVLTWAWGKPQEYDATKAEHQQVVFDPRRLPPERLAKEKDAMLVIRRATMPTKDVVVEASAPEQKTVRL